MEHKIHTRQHKADYEFRDDASRKAISRTAHPVSVENSDILEADLTVRDSLDHA